MQHKIDIGISIDVEKLLDTRALIQAGSGGGKSYAVRKTVESIASSKQPVQQIILDPEGEFVTLREKFDFVLISKDGDIPLSLKYAETLAYKLLETGVSAIIDLYELKHHERILFVKRFLDALINAPKDLWHSCFVYVDEAHIFCPESTKCESASSVIDLCTRGRKRGFAAILATQRLSKLHKDAAAECQNKLIGQTGLDIDRKRAGDELGLTGKTDTLKLRQLQPGEFYAFGPAISNEVIKFTVKPVVTTHLRSGKRMTVKPPTPNAIKKILSKLADIPKEAEAELITKQQLQAEITRLRTEVTKLGKGGLKLDEKDKLEGAIEQLKFELAETEKLRAGYAKLSVERGVKLNKIYAIVSEVGTETKLFEAPTDNTNKIILLPAKQNNPTVPPKIQPVQKPANSSTISTNLPEGERKILTACCQFIAGLLRNQLTTLCGYKRSSRDAYIQRLKVKSFIVQNGEKLMITAEGREALGPNFEPLPTGIALQEYWINNLPAGEAAILKILIAAFPEPVKRDDISLVTGYQHSSRDAYIQRMTAKEIVVAVGRGEVKASETLFD